MTAGLAYIAFTAADIISGAAFVITTFLSCFAHELKNICGAIGSPFGT